jgi:hypothetical protein
VRRAALLAVVALAGCGGDDGGDRDAYVRDGNAICRDYADAIGDLDQPAKLADIGPYIGDALPVLRSTAERIGKLDPPGDLRDAYEEFRDAAQATVGRAQELQAAAQAADGDEVQRLLEEARAASKRRVDLARAAGLDDCAQI